jgi:hypothetical protein
MSVEHYASMLSLEERVDGWFAFLSMAMFCRVALVERRFGIHNPKYAEEWWKMINDEFEAA